MLLSNGISCSTSKSLSFSIKKNNPKKKDNGIPLHLSLIQISKKNNLTDFREPIYNNTSVYIYKKEKQLNTKRSNPINLKLV